MNNEYRKNVELRRERYETCKIDYTTRRYADPAMQHYSKLRALTIYRVIKQHIKNDIPYHLIDVGCGTGVLLCQLSENKINISLFGIDHSDRQLRDAQISLSRDGSIQAHLVRASAFELSFPDNSFDAIVSTRFIHQYSDDLKEKLISEIRRCLKPDGIAIVEFYFYFPWLVRSFFAKRIDEDHFKHCTSKKMLRRFIGKRHYIIPLRLAGSTKLAKIISVRVMHLVASLLRLCRMSFVFDERLVVFGKVQND